MKRVTTERNEWPSKSTHTPDTSATMVVDPDEQVGETTPEPNAEVVVKGRNVEVPEHFRIYVSEKLSRL